MATRAFADRRTAGRKLAERLRCTPWVDPVVLGLARGGVPVAAEVARALGAPLDVVVSRKIGAPGRPEYGVGAVTPEGPPFYDRDTLGMLGLTPRDLADTCERERAEARRRERHYHGEHQPIPLREHDVLVVDDGLATGVTATAAVRAIRQAGPRRVVFAAPVAAPYATEALGGEVDRLVYIVSPAMFGAVGRWYHDFSQTSDEEVVELLAAAR